LPPKTDHISLPFSSFSLHLLPSNSSCLVFPSFWTHPVHCWLCIQSDFFFKCKINYISPLLKSLKWHPIVPEQSAKYCKWSGISHLSVCVPQLSEASSSPLLVTGLCPFGLLLLISLSIWPQVQCHFLKRAVPAPSIQIVLFSASLQEHSS
jgi:hypothetical protein